MDPKVKEITRYEGVTTIISWGSSEEPNARATWNTYLQFKDDNKILIPVAGFTSIQQDVKVNDTVKLLFGTTEIEGMNGYKGGTGYLLKGRAEFIESGEDFDKIKEDYQWINKVMVITVEDTKQLI